MRFHAAVDGGTPYKVHVKKKKTDEFLIRKTKAIMKPIFTHV